MTKKSRADYFKDYNANCSDTLSLRLQRGTKARWKEAAEARGMSLNAFVIECIEKAVSK